MCSSVIWSMTDKGSMVTASGLSLESKNLGSNPIFVITYVTSLGLGSLIYKMGFDLTSSEVPSSSGSINLSGHKSKTLVSLPQCEWWVVS